MVNKDDYMCRPIVPAFKGVLVFLFNTSAKISVYFPRTFIQCTRKCGDAVAILAGQRTCDSQVAGST